MTSADNTVDRGHQRRKLPRDRHRANAAAPPASLAHAERRPGASSSTHLDPLRHLSPSEVVVRTTGVPRTLGRPTLISANFRDGEVAVFCCSEFRQPWTACCRCNDRGGTGGEAELKRRRAPVGLSGLVTSFWQEQAPLTPLEVLWVPHSAFGTD